MILNRWALSMAAWLILLHSQAAGSPGGWLRVTSPHLPLVVMTTGEARTAGEAVGQLEGLRGYFRANWPELSTDGVPLKVVGFSSEWEYQAYRANGYSPAYFVGNERQGIIVVGRLERANWPALRHEYVHHVLKQSKWRLPLWLEEGLADALGGVDGQRAKARAEQLKRRGLMGLEELFAADKGSAVYHDRGAAQVFYAQSWVVADLLLRDGRYAGGFTEFLERVRAGEEAGRAYEETYGRGLGELRADVNRHVRRIQGRKAPGGVVQAGWQVEAADEVEVELLLAELQGRVGDRREAQQRIAALERREPMRAEVWQTKGDDALRRGERLEARLAYEEAVKLGGRDKRMLWELAVLEQANPERGAVVGVLEMLVEAAPEFDDARLVLSSHYLRERRWAEALEQLQRVKQPAPERAAYYEQALMVARRNAVEPTVALGSR